jgi:hypothetical protein
MFPVAWQSRTVARIISSAGVVAILLLIAFVPKSSGYVPTYYDQPGYTTSFESLIKGVDGSYAGVGEELALYPGGSSATASEAATIRNGLKSIRWGTRVIPALRVLGAVGLIVGTTELGWKIGRTVDTKWLHLFTTPAEIGSPSTAGRLRDYAPAEWYWTGTTWELQVYSDYGSPCGLTRVFAHVTATAYRNDLWGTDRTACSNFGRDAYAFLSELSGVAAIEDVSCGSMASLWTPAPSACFKMEIQENDMESRFGVRTFRDYVSGDENASGLTRVKLTSNYNPSYSAQGFPSQAAQTQAAINSLNVAPRAVGMFVDHALNPTGTVADPTVDFTWLGSTPDETYAQYVVRLQNAGWLGSATVVTLDQNNGDPDYRAGGVPCTSVATGTVVSPADEITIYKNADTFDSGDPNPNLTACPGRLDTTKTSNKCSFKKHQWSVYATGENKPFYDQTCDDAWDYFWANQWMFDEDGNIYPDLQAGDVVDIVRWEDLGDVEAWQKLEAIDPVRSHWAKSRTRQFAWDYPFEIHFYRHIPTNAVEFSVDFKLRFLDVFTP